MKDIASLFAAMCLRRTYTRGRGIQVMGEHPFVIRRGYQRHRARRWPVRWWRKR